MPKVKRDKKEKQPQARGLIEGGLNIFGLRIDLGELLTAPENLSGRLEELRQKLEAAGGGQGVATVTGHIRTGGLLGDQEYHIGTVGRPRGRGKPAPEPAEVTEPPVDVFDEGEQVTIVADVPGVSLEELELKVKGSVFSLSTRATARRSYRKELDLDAEVDPKSLQSSCQNGTLEVRMRKREVGKG